MWLLLTIPLNLVTVVITSVHSLLVMGALGLAFGLAQAYLQYHNKRRGQKLV